MANRNSLDYVYDYSAEPGFTKDKKTELPSHRITVRIRLNQGNVARFDLMSNELRTNNMSVSRPMPSSDIITISGIPPYTGFDENNVLNIVRKYNRAAQLA